jgi:hypothetical protein
VLIGGRPRLAYKTLVAPWKVLIKKKNLNLKIDSNSAKSDLVSNPASLKTKILREAGFETRELSCSTSSGKQHCYLVPPGLLDQSSQKNLAAGEKIRTQAGRGGGGGGGRGGRSGVGKRVRVLRIDNKLNKLI